MIRKILLAVVILLLAGGAAAFFLTHERVTDTRYTGYRGEARVNEFKAAELLLLELGVDVESRENLRPQAWLPDTSDTLFTRLDSTLAIPGARDLLIDWTTNGGHLVLLLPSESLSLIDEMLMQLGVSLVKLDTAPAKDAGDEPASEAGPGAGLDLSWSDQRIVTIADVPVLSSVADENGNLVLRRALGDGYLTLVAHEYMFKNYNLRTKDHGVLLMDVVDGGIEPGKVWLIYNAFFPSLWQLIWQNAPYAVLGCLMLLIIAMWSVMPTFGPITRDAPPERRSILEHIQAAGTFVWKQRGASDLGDAAASAVLHRAEARHPGIGRLAPARQAELIANLTGIDAQTVLDAIQNPAQAHHREFTQRMKTLQRTRKQL